MKMFDMERVMKWHIYNTEHEPLCWNNQVLEFDTFESAVLFLRGVNNIDEDILATAVIVEDILFYDGNGYINATNLRISEDEGCLVEREANMEVYENV
jgi:hypothetical protein